MKSNLIYFLQLLDDCKDHLLFQVYKNEESSQILKYFIENESIEFQKPFVQYLPILEKNKGKLNKIITSRVLIDNSCKNPLPITFVERSYSPQNIPENITNIFSDGSLSPKKQGGWAYIIKNENEMINSGFEEDSDSCRMELKAVIMALENCRCKNICVNTDSRYVKHGVEAWLPVWQINNYTTASNRPAKNTDLWKRMSTILDKKNIYWKWIKSGSGNHYHDICHNLARKEAGAKKLII